MRLHVVGKAKAIILAYAEQHDVKLTKALSDLIESTNFNTEATTPEENQYEQERNHPEAK